MSDPSGQQAVDVTDAMVDAAADFAAGRAIRIDRTEVRLLLQAALTTTPKPSVPWQVQAARWADRKAENAYAIAVSRHLSTYSFGAKAMGDWYCALAAELRALLSQPAKGGTGNG